MAALPVTPSGRSKDRPLHGIYCVGVEGLAFGQDFFGDAAEFADQAEPRENFQRVVGDVDFPPIEALTGAGHIVMMVVVPAFAERDQGQEPIILAGVGGGETAIAENVRERIDGERAVPEKNGAEEEAPEAAAAIRR